MIKPYAKKMMDRVCYFLILMILTLLAWIGIIDHCDADMYRYVDEKGRVHFTNVPTDPRYVLFFKSKDSNHLHKYSNFQYDQLIKKAAKTYDVDEDLIKAIIKAESDFNPKSISKKGAKGLMQLMPLTAKQMQVKNIFDPKENVMGGTRYLRHLLNTFDDTVLAVAAYNAGPIAVKKYGSVPPFSETINYVKKVFKFYNEFKLLTP